MSAAGLCAGHGTGRADRPFAVDRRARRPAVYAGASGAVNAAEKLTTIIAGMMCGADCINDANMLRAGGTPRVFDEVYAPSTLGIFPARVHLRAFQPARSGGPRASGDARPAASEGRAAVLGGKRLHWSERPMFGCETLRVPVAGQPCADEKRPAQSGQVLEVDGGSMSSLSPPDVCGQPRSPTPIIPGAAAAGCLGRCSPG